MHGFIVVDKPAGMTSHDVVARVRRLLKIKKVGHTGTLDPFATGVLPVAMGEATKAIPFLDEGEKEYRAVMRLGIATDTEDREGEVVSERPIDGIGEAEIRSACEAFVGTIDQIPPMYSALKRNGVPLYKLARKGEEVVREPRRITIHSLSVDAIDLPFVSFTVRCSRGTYVRSLARDIGDRLGCGAHLTELRRTRSGPFTLEQARTLEQLAEAVAAGVLPDILSPCAALGDLPEVILTAEGVREVRQGRSPGPMNRSPLPTPVSASPFSVRLTHEGALIAVALVASGGDEGGVTLQRGFN